MKKILPICLIIINIVVLSMLTYGYISVNNEKKVYKVAFWSDQREIDVTDLEIVSDKTYSGGIFIPHHFKVRGTITVEAKGYKGGRPYIKKVQISERLIEDNDKKIVYVDVYPIIGIMDDENYNFEKVPCTYEFEHTLNAYKWSENTYVINCLGKEQVIEMVNQK